jgi:phosphoglycolate phosphatase-like HAD superfamily hydrolase
MSAPYSVLALDLHNTIYDETMEYGPSIEEAVTAWIEVARERGVTLTETTLYEELAAGHRKLASDWDGEVWRFLPSLTRMGLHEAEFNKVMAKAQERRLTVSAKLTLSGLYPGAYETLSALKARGVHIYVVTEAAADTGMKAIEWLKLVGIVDGIYSYPARNMQPPPAGTYHKPFPNRASGEFLRKPHSFLLGAVTLDETIRRGDIPASMELDDVFSVEHDRALYLPELPDNTPVQQDISAKLVLKKTQYAEALKHTLDGMLYVGDSKFKDGLLARNAGVAFGYAAYGKKIKDGEADKLKKNLDIMYATTGWDKEVMKLTQEAGKSAAVAQLKPDYTFENSLAEASGLFA